MPRVTFEPIKVSVEVAEGENLLRAAMLAGVHINASCGGQGVCAKCRVQIASGQVRGGVTERLKKADFEAGYRLACRSEVVEDLTVVIPAESRLDSKIVTLQAIKPGAGVVSADLGADWLRERALFEPPFVTHYVEMKPPDLSANTSDLNRLLDYLGQQHHEHKLNIDFAIMPDLPEVVRAEDFKVTVTLTRPVREFNRSTLIKVRPGDRAAKNFGLAVDIGTTTVWGQLLDLNSGRVLAEQGQYNGQISYGEDVISRIIHASKPDGLKKLQQVVVGTINEVLGSLLTQSGVDADDITGMTVAGNTTMTQIFLGVNPKYIRLSPYTPAATYYPPIRASFLGLNLGRHVQALIFPCVASYVGGDIVSGVMGSGMYREDPLTLYIDVGTNGEIVVGNKDWLACAACSAGPAFEGGGVEHGMRAAPGAIEGFSLNPTTGEPMITTVGMARPKGVCGSGLINIVAALFEAGFIDEKGKFRAELPTERIREGESGREYVLAWAPDTSIGRDIYLTEVDIDNLIRAKGAMYAGYMTLLESVGLKMEDLDRTIIAGGFGRYLNLEKAITIGLLPEIPLNKITFIGNGSLTGARMVSLSNRMRGDVTEIVDKMTNFELSEVPGYMDRYVAALFLPHTDQNLFPGVIQRTKSLHQALGRARH